MKAVGIVALGVVVLLIIGTLWFHQALFEFIQSMRPHSMEATISFGKALDPSGQSVVDPTTTFHLGDNVAWVVRFKKSAGTRELIVALFEITKDGREIPLDRNKMAVLPTDVGVYNFTTTQAFWSLSPKNPKADRHTYRVKYLKDRVIVQGDFTIEAGRQDRPVPKVPSKAP